MEYRELYNGVKIPMLGYGVFRFRTMKKLKNPWQRL